MTNCHIESSMNYRTGLSDPPNLSEEKKYKKSEKLSHVLPADTLFFMQAYFSYFHSVIGEWIAIKK